MSAYFVTGTDTNIGKTFVSGLLCKHFNAAYFKPIQSGTATGDDDCKTVQELAELPTTKIFRPIYSYQAPLSPHRAAMLENQVIDFDKLTLPSEHLSPLIVEGAGGIFVPINDKYLMIDLIVKLNLPVILVTCDKLGTINHTLLTIAALRHHKIPIKTVIINQSDGSAKNRQDIEKYGEIDIDVVVPTAKNITEINLNKVFQKLSL